MCELGDGVTQRFTRIKLKLLAVSSIFRSYFLCSMNQQVPTIQSNANASDFTFTREEFESAPTRQLLRNGRAANAIVWRLRKNGITWTVKDFSKRSWFVRTFIGPFLIRRELAALSRLKNINGIAGRAFRIDRSAMAVEFLEGDSLERIAPERITVEYLCQLEDLISQMHSSGLCISISAVLAMCLSALMERRVSSIFRRQCALTTGLRACGAFSKLWMCPVHSNDGNIFTLKPWEKSGLNGLRRSTVFVVFGSFRVISASSARKIRRKSIDLCFLLDFC